MKTQPTDVFICDCYSTEHQIVIYYSEYEDSTGKKYPMVYFHVHLNKPRFWDRLRNGIRYIFGYQCRYGAFDEFIFNPEDADRLQKVVDYLKIKE
jgi:hypothetical protein